MKALSERTDLPHTEKLRWYISVPCLSQIAKMVVFLASNDSAMVTGSTYTMDGGWTIKA